MAVFEETGEEPIHERRLANDTGLLIKEAVKPVPVQVIRKIHGGVRALPWFSPKRLASSLETVIIAMCFSFGVLRQAFRIRMVFEKSP